ncbi:hypothetical protein I5M27_17925 [Adhaeribacter sp. BT258]|uniref:Uncharacterized protein n=1 Tax=Adhaeribacter terrigena TaxID=2793070 RepID=A0ABS1C672_9BACT|nr:hypothetical protein [Adhaeribacter terrigena]MBK0404875.1 hypothetical protein [Adhaeribacter terrigena]
MSDSNLNIQLSYLYRDAGNYKQFGNIIFSNPENIPLEVISAKIRAALIDGEYFVASKWQIPALQSFHFDEELDHNWHEFEDIESTKEEVTNERSISEFLNQL